MGHKDLLSLLTQKGQLCVIWIFNVFAVQRLVASWKNKFMAYPRLSGEIQTLESNCKFETCKLKTGEHIFSHSHLVKFIYSEKASKFCRNLHLRFVLCNGQIYGGDFTKFCSLLRIYDHQKLSNFRQNFTNWSLGE